MAKQSKRSRKFQASGGVAGRLKKGTLTKHGKLKKRAKQPPQQQQQQQHEGASSSKQPTVRDRADDIAAPKNFFNMDLDAFFAQVANNLEHDKEEEDDESIEHEDNDKEADSDDNDDSKNEEGSDDDEQEEEELTKFKASKKASSKDYGKEESSDSDDSDDEDVEAAEARMKKEMARLTEKDPDFAEFLMENEEHLLEFGQDEQDHEQHDNDEDEASPEDEPMEDDDDDDKFAMEQDNKPTSSSSTLLTMALLDKLRRRTFDAHGVKALKKLTAAYKSGCHLADATPDTSSAYAIESSKIFDSLMILCLSRCHEAFAWHLLGPDALQGSNNEKEENDDDKDQQEDKKNSQLEPESKPVPPHKLENADKWEAIKPTLQSFLRSTIHLLTESKEPGLLSFVLKSLGKYLPLMTPFPRIAEALLKTCINLWSAPLDTSETFQVVRLQAFFRIRQLAITQPFPFIETCLKKTYLAYTQRATFGTASSLATTLPTLTFMGNCLVELYSLDYQSSYQHAFVYIRQLALYLRAAVQKKSPEAFKQVYGWQYMHSLKLWVAVLAHASTKEDEDPDAKLMSSLFYPLAEIVLGTARTAPSPVRLLPLRLQCIRLLQQLAASSQIYLPTTSLLLDCMDWKEWYNKPKKATKRNTLRGGLPLYMLLKLPKEDPLRTHEQLEAGLVQIFVLLEREMELYRYTAAFAEFCVRIRQRCRDFSKVVRPSRWKAYAKACIAKADQYALYCTTERTKLALAPKDVTQLECLRPSHVPTMRERHQKALDQETKSAQSALATAAAASLAKTNAAGKGKDDGNDHDDEEDDQDAADNSDKEQEEEEKPKEPAKKSTKKKPKKKPNNAMVPDNDEVMKERDEVVEGADWLED